MREIHISKSDLREARIAEATPAQLPQGAARLKLDLFALTRARRAGAKSRSGVSPMSSNRTRPASRSARAIMAITRSPKRST
jgi:hypothetical protein